MSDSNNDVNWERKVLEKLALEALAEQRRGRRWGIFFKLLGFGYLALVLVLALDLGSGDNVAEGEKFTALVNLNGVIKAKGWSATSAQAGSSTAISVVPSTGTTRAARVARA